MSMLLYVTVGTNNLERAIEFYDPVLSTLGYVRVKTSEDEAGYAVNANSAAEFWVLYPYDKQEASAGNGSMIAFAAADRAAVSAFHAKAMLYGGHDEGAPGLRRYTPHFFAAYIRDPDGNKLSAVFDQPE
ncbi:catechol 2,3-dioxygenase-like lactoylglutathione lyase family enzyme [Rhizobium alvei]